MAGRRVARVAGRSLGVVGLAVLAGIAAGGIGGLVIGTLTFPIIGTVIGAVLGGVIAVVPSTVLAVVAGAVAAGTPARNLPLALAMVGLVGTGLLAGSIGAGLIDDAGWITVSGIWLTIPVHVAFLYLIGRSLQREDVGPPSHPFPPPPAQRGGPDGYPGAPGGPPYGG
jgi:hypothetical protein